MAGIMSKGVILPALSGCLLILSQGCGTSGAATVTGDQARPSTVESAVASPVPVPTPAIESRTNPTLEELLESRSVEGFSLDLAGRVVRSDSAASAKLKAVLKDNSKQNQWQPAVVMAGLTGDFSMYQELAAFFLRNDSDKKTGLLPARVYRAKGEIPLGMSMLLKRLNEETPTKERSEAKVRIRRFIHGHLSPNPAFWKDITWAPSDYAGKLRANMLVDLSLDFVQAVGSSGDKEAMSYLDWLEGHLKEWQRETRDGTDQKKVADKGYTPGVVDKGLFEAYQRAISAAKNPKS